MFCPLSIMLPDFYSSAKLLDIILKVCFLIRSEHGEEVESQTKLDLNVDGEEKFEDEEEQYNEGRLCS